MSCQKPYGLNFLKEMTQQDWHFTAERGIFILCLHFVCFRQDLAILYCPGWPQALGTSSLNLSPLSS